MVDPRFESVGFAPALTQNWYAISVYPRHEKSVARHFEGQGTEYFLPLYSSLRRWKDRKKEIDMVLFPGYIFVRIVLDDRLRVLMVPGVSRFITFQDLPAVVPEEQIQAIGLTSTRGVAIRPHPYLQKGCRVRIVRGPMAGVEGILSRRKDKFRVVLSIDLIASSVAVEVEGADLEPLS